MGGNGTASFVHEGGENLLNQILEDFQVPSNALKPKLPPTKLFLQRTNEQRTMNDLDRNLQTLLFIKERQRQWL